VLKFSRDEEREADLVGLDIAARAGFDPRAGVVLWNKMASLDGRGAPIELLSTHPGGANRIEQIQDHMNVLLPLYARARGTSVDRLPPYRTNLAVR
jgi:predicted Zn-dependent protease